MTAKLYRHGEIGLEHVSTLPADLNRSDTKILMAGSHGNNHSINNGEILPTITGEIE
jgi:hypothetical protein